MFFKKLFLTAALPLALLVVAQPPSPAQQQATAADHKQMMEQLGIRALRPGPSGNEKAPNAANYDESKANPFPDYPAVLVRKDGTAVKTAADWNNFRRPEVVEDFEREVLGRVPANAPKITWTVTRTIDDKVGPYPVVAQELTGRADNSAAPQITVEIKAVLVRPAWIQKPVPVMIQFGRAAVPSAPIPPAMARFAAQMAASAIDPPASQQLIAQGWGYAMLDPASVQADNGAGLTAGIIGLVNKGQPRKPEDWGALRAWAWGASRLLDYLETLPSQVDSRKVGIEGVSRYGKAALVTMAYDTRFAVVLIGSSGEGGAKPHRRNFGEAVENLTGSGEYHWMAGNFLKYGAAESSFGSKNAGDIPVDAHELIALCAPRATFVSYGIPEKGDAKWLDQQGSFMATVAAQPVFRLLGAKDLGVTEDYHVAKMPPVNTGLLNGQLAWRQHDGGHTDGPNWKYFIPWASKQLSIAPAPAFPVPADVAAARVDANSLVAHGQLLDKRKAGKIDIYFEGDSITRRWGATDYPELLANWNANFKGWNAADFGWGADRTQNILWRLEHGELDGVNPKIVVLMAGTNNIDSGFGKADAPEVTRGLAAIVARIREKAPDAVVVLTAVMPRFDKPGLKATVDGVNENLARMADGKKVIYVDLNSRITREMMNPDGVHPNVKAYQVWADALKPVFEGILGPPAAEDHAPPATGDPSAAARKR